MKAIIKAVYLWLGLIISGMLLMPLMAWMLVPDFSEFIKNINPLRASLLLFIGGIWVMISTICLLTKDFKTK